MCEVNDQCLSSNENTICSEEKKCTCQEKFVYRKEEKDCLPASGLTLQSLPSSFLK